MHTPGTGHPILWPFSRLERQLLFVPERSFRGTPEHVGLAFEDIFPVTSGGVKLHGWHIPGKSTKVAWLIFHGNGGNISVRLDQYAEINRRYGASVVVSITGGTVAAKGYLQKLVSMPMRLPRTSSRANFTPASKSSCSADRWAVPWPPSWQP